MARMRCAVQLVSTSRTLIRPSSRSIMSRHRISAVIITRDLVKAFVDRCFHKGGGFEQFICINSDSEANIK